jgi:hypothetical protein
LHVSSSDSNSPDQDPTHQTSEATSTRASWVGSFGQTQPSPTIPDRDFIDRHTFLSAALHGMEPDRLGYEHYWNGTDAVGDTWDVIKTAVNDAIPGDRPGRGSRPVPAGSERGI